MGDLIDLTERFEANARKKNQVIEISIASVLKVMAKKIEDLKTDMDHVFASALKIDYRTMAIISVLERKMLLTGAELENAENGIRRMIGDRLEDEFSQKNKLVDTDRPAKEGDMVVVAIKANRAGKILVDLCTERALIADLGQGMTFIKEFEEKLIGLSASETKVFELMMPDNTNFAGEKVDFEVTLLRVKDKTPTKVE